MSQLRAIQEEKAEMREELQQLAARLEETAPKNIFFQDNARPPTPLSPIKAKRPSTASSARLGAGNMSRASSCHSIASPRNHDKLEAMRETIVQELDSVKSFVMLQCSQCRFKAQGSGFREGLGRAWQWEVARDARMLAKQVSGFGFRV